MTPSLPRNQGPRLTHPPPTPSPNHHIQAFKFIVDDEWRFAPDQLTVADVEGRINNFIDVTHFKPFNEVGGWVGGWLWLWGVFESSAFPRFSSDSTHPPTLSPTKKDSSTLDIAKKEEELYGTTYPDVDEYSVKEPPPLPPHLRHIILNKVRCRISPPARFVNSSRSSTCFLPRAVLFPTHPPIHPPTHLCSLSPIQSTQVPNEKTPLNLPVPQHVAVDHLYCTAIKDGMMVLGVTQRFRMKFVTTVYYSMMP